MGYRDYTVAVEKTAEATVRGSGGCRGTKQ